MKKTISNVFVNISFILLTIYGLYENYEIINNIYIIVPVIIILNLISICFLIIHTGYIFKVGIEEWKTFGQVYNVDMNIYRHKNFKLINILTEKMMNDNKLDKFFTFTLEMFVVIVMFGSGSVIGYFSGILYLISIIIFEIFVVFLKTIKEKYGEETIKEYVDYIKK